MKYWGAEVKSGKALKVQPAAGKVLHLSQACLGEVSGKGKGKGKGNESVCLFVNIDGQRLVLGTLTTGELNQQLFDLVFEKDFELSHNWKNGSVHFLGYKSAATVELTSDEDSEDSGSDYDNILQEAAKIVKPESKAKKKKSLKIAEPGKDKKPEDDDDGSVGSSDSDSGNESSDSDSGNESSDDSDTD